MKLIRAMTAMLSAVLLAASAAVLAQQPIKVGMSLKNYYELAGVDHTFGYLSLGAVATVPLGDGAYGGWNAPVYMRTPGPPWAMPNECFTDEGYGRYTPCDRGGRGR